MLKYNKALVNSILESGGDIPDDGIEDAFDVLHEFNEKCVPIPFIPRYLVLMQHI